MKKNISEIQVDLHKLRQSKIVRLDCQ